MEKPLEPFHCPYRLTQEPLMIPYFPELSEDAADPIIHINA
jgi:hypothetical protein